MTKLEGTQRKTFIENLGRQYAGTGYYRDADVALRRAMDFQMYASLELDFRTDMSDFFRGFDEVQDLRKLVMLLKAKAQADNKLVLQELEGKGLTFLRKRVEAE